MSPYGIQYVCITCLIDVRAGVCACVYRVNIACIPAPCIPVYKSYGIASPIILIPYTVHLVQQGMYSLLIHMQLLLFVLIFYFFAEKHVQSAPQPSVFFYFYLIFFPNSSCPRRSKPRAVRFTWKCTLQRR